MITDAFSYSNGALSGNAGWANTAYQGSFTVSGGQLVGGAGETRCNLRSDSWGSAQGSGIEIATPASSMFTGVIIHGTLGSGVLQTGYLLSLSNSGNWDLFRYDAGTDTPLAGNPTGVAAAAGDKIFIQAVGGNILVRVRDTDEEDEPLIEFADNTYRNGTPGILLYREGNAVVYDNWWGTGEATGTPGNASGAGATATTSAPGGSAQAISVKLTGLRLISKVGAPLASLSGITALIYKSVPTILVAPDKRVGSLTTNGSGILADIDLSDIQSTNSAVWLVLMLDGSPAKATAVKLVPTVS